MFVLQNELSDILYAEDSMEIRFQNVYDIFIRVIILSHALAQLPVLYRMLRPQIIVLFQLLDT